MLTVVLAGSLDTKGDEYDAARTALQRRGLRVVLVDTSVLGEPTIVPDVPRGRVLAAAGATLTEIRTTADRSAALARMSDGLTLVLREMYDAGEVDACLALGGSGILATASKGFRELPLGVPKLIVTTMAASDTAPFIGTSDLLLMPAIVDVAGLNRVSRFVVERAAATVAALLDVAPVAVSSGISVAASMFGVTTAGVTAARRQLERAGCEVLIFHANGIGGRTLEAVVEAGWLDGVLDLTTTEVADDLVGGVATAGPDRLTAAARIGLPQIVSVGGCDIVNFWDPASVPEQFEGRLFYKHSPTATLMRTSVAECSQLGAVLAAKANASSGPVKVVVPTTGLSSLSVPGRPFADECADAALIEALQDSLDRTIPCTQVDGGINDDALATLAADQLLQLIM